MTTIEIFHNVATDDQAAPVGLFGYEPAHPVVKVYELHVSANADTIELDLAELALRFSTGACRESADYRNRMLREISIGDMVRVGETWLSRDPFGWSVVNGHTPRDVTDKYQRKDGTRPWQQTLREDQTEQADAGL